MKFLAENEVVSACRTGFPAMRVAASELLGSATLAGSAGAAATTGGVCVWGDTFWVSCCAGLGAGAQAVSASIKTKTIISDFILFTPQNICYSIISGRRTRTMAATVSVNILPDSRRYCKSGDYHSRRVVYLEKQEYVRPRNVNLALRVTQDERNMIERRMAQTGMKSLREYIVKMAVDGRVIHVELESVKEMVRLLSNATNNINQIARRANQTGNIYAADLGDLRKRYDEIWGQTKLILKKLAVI